MPIPTDPSTAKLSTAVTAVSIVVVVPFTVKLPLKVASVPVTVPTVMFGVPVSPSATVALLAVPVTAPVSGPVKLPAVTFPVTFWFRVVAVTTPVTIIPFGKLTALPPSLPAVSYTHLTLPTTPYV